MEEDIANNAESEIEEVFLKGVMHHNPHISFNAEMTDQVLEEIEALNNDEVPDFDASKRRKRVLVEAASTSPPPT